MNVQDLMKNAHNLTDYEFERKLNNLVRENYRYKNLSPENREVVMDLFKKHKARIRAGRGLSYTERTNEVNKLTRDRAKLGLTLEDVKDIKEILAEFKA